MYLIIDEVDGFIGESNGNKFLIFASTDGNKKVWTKYAEIWDRIKNSVEKINDRSGKYGNNSMKLNQMIVYL